MHQYDVIVVGGGPAGCSAARAAAERGLRTLILEEHAAIGLPRHCPGRIQGSSFTEAIISKIDQRVVLTYYKSRRVYAPSGKLVQEIPLAGRGLCMVARDEFDRELARLAVRAGAKILLHTRVKGLLKEGSRIIGVTTESNHHPEIVGKVVISAEGIQAGKGIPGQEEMVLPDKTREGVLLELTNVKRLDPEVLETHIGEMVQKRFCTIWPRDDTSCFVSFSSLEVLERIKNGKYLLSEKLKDAIPIQGNSSKVVGVAQVLHRLIKNGLMLVGNAAGYTGIIHAIISGSYAGEVSAEAILKGDVRMEKLIRYEELCRSVGLHLTGPDWMFLDKLAGLADDELESILPSMVERNELGYLDQLPF